MVLGSHPAHPQARLVPPSGPVDTADAADPASRPPAVLTVNAALHRVTLCRHQQRALQGHGGRHPRWASGTPRTLPGTPAGSE